MEIFKQFILLLNLNLLCSEQNLEGNEKFYAIVVVLYYTINMYMYENIYFHIKLSVS